ncbi:hypothetical protein ACQPW3_19095 [Actinosynnema sp. CA-248983]
MGDLPHRVPHDPRYFTADVHITPDGRARIGNHTYTPEQYGDLLRRNGWDGKTPIRLIGCDAGTNDFARRLSHHTGADVLAPTKPAWTDSKGRVYTSDAETGPDGNRQPKIPPNGEWETHRPDGTKTKTSQDGYVPGTPDHHRTGHTDPDDARDRMAKPVKPIKDSPDYDRSPQQQTAWDPPRQPNGDPLPEVPMDVDTRTRVADFNGREPLQPNSRMVVTDTDGNPRGVFYTDANRNITHVETSLPNKGFGQDPFTAPVNPDTSRPMPGVTYRIELGHNMHHTYEAPTPHDRGPSGPEPEATVPPARDPSLPPADPQPPQRFDAFERGDAAPAVDWNPPGDADGNYRMADPIRDYDVRQSGPFSLTGPRDRDTRYDVYDKDGNWHGSFYTDADGNFSHVHTWSGNQVHGFNPELGTGRTWSDKVDVPRPNTTYAVGPRHLESSGYDPREPRQLYRTDEHGDTIAVSGRPDYPPAGTTAEDHWGPRRGERGPDKDGRLQTDVGQIATGAGRGSNRMTGELDQHSRPVDERPLFRFAGGHLVSYEAGGPGERINHVPQWAHENSNWELDERPTSDSWRAMENDLTGMGQRPDATVDRFDVWAERHTPDRRTPDVLHARWTLSTDNPPTIRTEGRSFHNVPGPARHPDFVPPPPATP